MTPTTFPTRTEGKVSLLLYMKPTCPYCQKVLRVCENLGLSLPMVDILADPTAKANLIAIGGKQQVPCLFVDGKPLYESDAIVDYLSNHLILSGELRP